MVSISYLLSGSLLKGFLARAFWPQRRGVRTLYAVLGDHGMTEQGNHGGNSQLETETALLLLSSQYVKAAGAQCMCGW